MDKYVGKIMKNMLGMVFLAFGLCGCVTTTGNYRPIGDHSYPPRITGCDVEIFRDHAPSRPYTAISQLAVHVEKTALMASDYASASDELKYQACMSGADAVIDFKEQKSSYLETRMYNLTATGIRWMDRATRQ
ncbi:hypothetical protein [Pinirhizobacter soli]|uniref:hypothetical protein n=1 Tax=Pinirhizobacter soli TaxID=2786953 RepID=UPI00202AB28B|nr:hypothetical protein [Pinirhizobacter soli]